MPDGTPDHDCGRGFVMSGGFMLVPETLDNLINTTEAAAHCGVEKSTITKWRERGHLAVSGLDPSGRPLYRLIDVLKAARDTRRRALGQGRVA